MSGKKNSDYMSYFGPEHFTSETWVRFEIDPVTKKTTFAGTKTQFVDPAFPEEKPSKSSAPTTNWKNLDLTYVDWSNKNHP